MSDIISAKYFKLTSNRLHSYSGRHLVYLRTHLHRYWLLVGERKSKSKGTAKSPYFCSTTQLLIFVIHRWKRSARDKRTVTPIVIIRPSVAPRRYLGEKVQSCYFIYQQQEISSAHSGLTIVYRQYKCFSIKFLRQKSAVKRFHIP